MPVILGQIIYLVCLKFYNIHGDITDICSIINIVIFITYMPQKIPNVLKYIIGKLSRLFQH